MSRMVEKIVKSIIQTLIDTYLGKDYVLVHRSSYTDLLKSKNEKHVCKCGGHCRSKENGDRG